MASAGALQLDGPGAAPPWLAEELGVFRQAILTDIHGLLGQVRLVHEDLLRRQEHVTQQLQAVTVLHEYPVVRHVPTATAPAPREGERAAEADLQADLQEAGNKPKILLGGEGPVCQKDAPHVGTMPSDPSQWHSAPAADLFGPSHTVIDPSHTVIDPTGPSGADPEQAPERGHEADHARVHGGSGAFAGLHVTKDTSALDKEIYDVANFYHEKGCSQAIARSEVFSQITLGIIALNAAYMGVDADHNKEEVLFKAKWPFQLSEYLFCAFFCFEWIVRFRAFRRKRDCLRDFWFRFDSFLVVLMLVETWVMPLFYVLSGSSGSAVPMGPLRLLRLLRLTRMARLMRALPELMTMVKGMRTGARAVGSSLLMVGLLIYVFAIVMHMLLKDEEFVEAYFSTLPRCMWTLLMDGTLMDSPGFVLSKLIWEGRFNTAAAVLIFLIFVLFSAITVMNMLIGVLCEVVSSVAAEERQDAAIGMLKETILVELHRFDADGNGMISQDELQQVLNDPHAVGVLRSLEVDMQYLKEMQRMLFPQADTLVAIDRIMELMLMCRGDLNTTVKHMATGQAYTRAVLCGEIQRHERRMLASLEALRAPVATGGFPGELCI